MTRNTLPPEAIPELTRLWSTTSTHRDDVAAILNATFGLDLTGAKVASHAKERRIQRATRHIAPAAIPAAAPAPRAPSPVLTGVALADMERMWERGTLTPKEIVAAMGARHGITLTVGLIESRARKRGWTRDLMARNQNHPQMREQKLALQSVHRWATGARREDNPVRLVRPGTFRAPSRGFRLGGQA